MLEALVAADVARLEAQAREPVAADELVAPAGGRDEHEPAATGGSPVVWLGRSWLAGSAVEVMASMIGPRGRSFDGPLSNFSRTRLRPRGVDGTRRRTSTALGREVGVPAGPATSGRRERTR